MDNKYSFGFLFEFKNKASRPAKAAQKAVESLTSSVVALQAASKKEISQEQAEKYAAALKKMIPAQRAANKATEKGTRAQRKMRGSLQVLGRAWRSNRAGIRMFHAALLAVTASKVFNGIRAGARLLGRTLVDVINVGKEFDQTLVATSSNMRLNAVGSEKLRTFVKKMGATTEKTAREVATGMRGLSQSGFNLADAMRITEPAIKLAGATLTKYEKTLDIVKDTMAVFQIKSQDALKTTDILSSATLSSATNLSQLGLGLRQVSGVASSANRDLHETVAVLGVFAQSGQRGARGGVAFRNILASITKPSKSLSRVLKFLGKDIKALSPETNDFATIFSRLQPLMKRTDLIWSLFGKRTAPAFLSFMKQGAGAVNKMQKAMRSQNSTAKLYAKNMNTVAGRIKIFQSATEGLKIELFDLIKKQFKDDLKDATVLVGRISTAVKRAGPVIQAVFRGAGEVVRFAVREILGGTRAMLKGFDVLTRAGRVNSSALKNVIAPLVVAVGIAKNSLITFVAGMVKGFKSGFTAAKFYLVLLLTPLFKVAEALLYWTGVIEKGDNKLTSFAKVLGFTLGAFSAFAIAKLALLIPSFVLTSIASAARMLWAIGTVIFTRVIPSIILFTKTLWTKHLPALAAWISSTGIVSGVSLIALRAALWNATATIVGMTGAILLQAAAWAATPIGQAVIVVVALAAATFFLIKYWKEWTGWIQKAGLWMDAIIVSITLFLPFVGATLALVRHWEKLGGAISFVMKMLRKIPGMKSVLGDPLADQKKKAAAAAAAKRKGLSVFDFDNLPALKAKPKLTASQQLKSSSLFGGSQGAGFKNALSGMGFNFGGQASGSPQSFQFPKSLQMPAGLSKSLQMPQVPAGAGASTGPITINVYATQNMNIEELANKVKEVLERKAMRGAS